MFFPDITEFAFILLLLSIMKPLHLIDMLDQVIFVYFWTTESFFNNNY